MSLFAKLWSWLRSRVWAAALAVGVVLAWLWNKMRRQRDEARRDRDAALAERDASRRSAMREREIADASREIEARLAARKAEREAAGKAREESFAHAIRASSAKTAEVASEVAQRGTAADELNRRIEKRRVAGGP
jgi:flagellar biosynthesis/type III secretory pathway M-ring protein FliF/YscJ